MLNYTNYVDKTITTTTAIAPKYFTITLHVNANHGIYYTMCAFNLCSKIYICMEHNARICKLNYKYTQLLFSLIIYDAHG